MQSPVRRRFATLCRAPGRVGLPLALGAALGLSACKSDDKPAPDAAKAPPSAAPSDAASMAPSAPPSLPPPPAPKLEAAAWARIFAVEGGPALPGPLSAVQLGQTRAEVLAAVPGLATDAAPTEAAADGGAPTPVRPARTLPPDTLTWEGLRFTLHWQPGDERLRYVAVSLPPDAPEGLTARWGAPVEGRVGPRRKASWWIAPARQLQAVLEGNEKGAHLSFWPLTPWQTLLGTGDRTRLGFEASDHPLLGATADQVEAAYPRLTPRRIGPDRIDLYLPPHEYTDRPVVVHLSLTDGKVSTLEFKLTYLANAALRDAFREGLTAKYGAPVQGVFGEKPRVEVDDAPGSGRITVRLTP